MSLLRKMQIFTSNIAKLWTIDDANTARTTGTIVGAVQIVDQSGKVPPSGEAVGNAPFTKLTDGTNVGGINPANTARATSTVVVTTQHVDSSGKVQPAGEVATNPIYVKITDGVAALETSAGSLSVIDCVHNEIHEGSSYHSEHLFLAVANEAAVYIRILTDEKYLHFVYAINAQLKTYAYLYEDTTYNANGTAVPAYNNNRSSVNDTDALVYHTPTVNVIGTAIRSGSVLPAGIKTTPIGSSLVSRNELILDAATDYLIKIVSAGGSASSNDIGISLDWYEVD